MESAGEGRSSSRCFQLSVGARWASMGELVLEDPEASGAGAE